jgi:hypothetical protein
VSSSFNACMSASRASVNLQAAQTQPVHQHGYARTTTTTLCGCGLPTPPVKAAEQPPMWLTQ